jgi:hypothetical protein
MPYGPTGPKDSIKDFLINIAYVTVLLIRESSFDPFSPDSEENGPRSPHGT